MTVKKITYSISELANMAQVSRRTVRYYIQRGLLPPPEGRGRGSYYTARHFELLLSIKKAQLSGVSLEQLEQEELESFAEDLSSNVLQNDRAFLSVQEKWTHIPVHRDIVVQFREGSLSIENQQKLCQLIQIFLTNHQESSHD